MTDYQYQIIQSSLIGLGDYGLLIQVEPVCVIVKPIGALSYDGTLEIETGCPGIPVSDLLQIAELMEGCSEEHTFECGIKQFGPKLEVSTWKLDPDHEPDDNLVGVYHKEEDILNLASFEKVSYGFHKKELEAVVEAINEWRKENGYAWREANGISTKPFALRNAQIREDVEEEQRQQAAKYGIDVEEYKPIVGFAAAQPIGRRVTKPEPITRLEPPKPEKARKKKKIKIKGPVKIQRKKPKKVK
jgi:hypothetical protein